ncbi:hypothetical protein BC830DRAFT_224796 [Chytriomyces sp. MP71]|nr:hypothetical protein BC830DRAFT_224796 [Chytriomyces sp. MP71]
MTILRNTLRACSQKSLRPITCLFLFLQTSPLSCQFPKFRSSTTTTLMNQTWMLGQILIWIMLGKTVPLSGGVGFIAWLQKKWDVPLL